MNDNGNGDTNPNLAQQPQSSVQVILENVRRAVTDGWGAKLGDRVPELLTEDDVLREVGRLALARWWLPHATTGLIQLVHERAGIAWVGDETGGFEDAAAVEAWRATLPPDLKWQAGEIAAAERRLRQR